MMQHLSRLAVGLDPGIAVVRHRGLREFFEHARGEWDGPRNQQKPRFHGIGQRWVGRYFKLPRHILSRNGEHGQSRTPSSDTLKTASASGRFGESISRAIRFPPFDLRK